MMLKVRGKNADHFTAVILDNIWMFQLAQNKYFLKLFQSYQHVNQIKSGTRRFNNSQPEEHRRIGK